MFVWDASQTFYNHLYKISAFQAVKKKKKKINRLKNFSSNMGLKECVELDILDKNLWENTMTLKRSCWGKQKVTC